MTWIKHTPYDQADEELKRVYESVRGLYPVEYAGPPVPSLVRPDGEADSIVAVHSPIPEAMQLLLPVPLDADLRPNRAAVALGSLQLQSNPAPLRINPITIKQQWTAL